MELQFLILNNLLNLYNKFHILYDIIKYIEVEVYVCFERLLPTLLAMSKELIILYGGKSFEKKD